MVEKFCDQDFYEIRESLLAEGKLFEDDVFPANMASLFYRNNPLQEPFQWQRPDLKKKPEFFVDGSSRFDVQQGELGDCWLLAGLANLTLHDKLFAQVVPNDQGFGEDYAGIFHFRFWQFGRWLDVVIDDRLPFRDGELVLVHSSTKNEFWSALFEKAFAKLNGTYESLDGGFTSEALEDFTGGLTEVFELTDAPKNLPLIMLKAYERSSLMGASITANPEVKEEKASNGLVKGHAYSITQIRFVHIETPKKQGRTLLVRLRNPWGNYAEWVGAWSDGSREWQFIPEHEKETIQLTFKEDGEFWMSFPDFKASFTTVEICHLCPDTFIGEVTADENMARWEMHSYEAEWVRGSTAGGCANFPKTFWRNPQYVVKVDDPDEDDEDNNCTLIVALTQKDRRSQRFAGKDNVTIGLALFRLPDLEDFPKPLTPRFLTEKSYVQPPASFTNFINLREVVCRYEVPPGQYVIVPSTFEPGEEAEILLRVYTEKRSELIAHDAALEQGTVDVRITNAKELTAKEQRKAEKINDFFHKVAGRDKRIDWMELQQVLDYAMKSGGKRSDSLACGISSRRKAKKGVVSKDVCRSLISLMDQEQTGTLNLEEFKDLWAQVQQLTAAFRLYDEDKSNFLNAFELRDALDSAGFKINSRTLNILVRRYSTKVGEIALDDFIMCTIKLKKSIDFYKQRDPENIQNVSFKIDEWIEKTMYS